MEAKYLKICRADLATTTYDKQREQPAAARPQMGTPRLSVRLKNAGACFWQAIWKKVLLSTYVSELAAEKTKRRMQPLMKLGSTLMPAILIATTKGLAVAFDAALVAEANWGELEGTNRPTRKMRPMYYMDRQAAVFNRIPHDYQYLSKDSQRSGCARKCS